VFELDSDEEFDSEESPEGKDRGISRVILRVDGDDVTESSLISVEVMLVVTN